MPDKINELASTLTDAMRNTSNKKTKEYDTSAKVTRIDEEGRVWVSIPGGVRETPVRRTFSVKPGDEVQVHVGGGRAWMQGNYTSPPTDDTRANQAYSVAAESLDSAALAKIAADSAQESAEEARKVTDEIEQYADTAKKSVTDILQDAEDAHKNADSAAESATIALNQLGFIENVVGVLDLLSKNGDYQRTEDTVVIPEKWYFIRSGSYPNYEYQVVSTPSGNPSAQDYFELVGVRQAVQNYVSSHLVLDNQGLWLQTDGASSKILLSSAGVILYDTDGKPVAEYGQDTIIGDRNTFHIKIDSTNNEIGFYNGPNLTDKIAYMNGSQLYVKNSLSFGHFIFYERTNGHFTLKKVD